MPRASREVGSPDIEPVLALLTGQACLARNAAALTRFWQVVEQNRLVPFFDVST